MVAREIAAKLDMVVWLDKAGNIVKTEKQAFGQKLKNILLHPNKLLFIDEVGSNTSQAKDGHCGGKKFLVPSQL